MVFLLFTKLKKKNKEASIDQFYIVLNHFSFGSKLTVYFSVIFLIFTFELNSPQFLLQLPHHTLQQSDITLHKSLHQIADSNNRNKQYKI